MSAAKPRVATVGTGYFSQFHYDAWQRLDVDVVGICSLSLDDAKRVAGGFDDCPVFDRFEAMLDQVKPDLVDIIVPPDGHLAMISAAADRGINMICQKPFTRSYEEAEQAAEIAAKAGVFVVVHENFRFQPWHIKVKDLISTGTIGSPYQVSFRMRPGDGQGPEAYLERQPYFQKMERFLVHETAIHFIDVFRYLFGEIADVTADLKRLNPDIAGEDAGLILFNFDNGWRGLFDGNRLSDHAARNRRLTMGEMLVEGSDGTISLNGDGEIFLRKFGENDEQAVPYDLPDRGFGGDCVFGLQKHVIDHLTSGGELSNTARDYLANIRVEEAVYRSNQEGARVSL